MSNIAKMERVTRRDVRSCKGCKFNVPAERERQRDPRYGDGWDHDDLVVTRKCLIDENILDDPEKTTCECHRRDGEPFIK